MKSSSTPTAETFFEGLAEQVPDFPRENLERGFIAAVRGIQAGACRQQAVAESACGAGPAPRAKLRFGSHPWPAGDRREVA